MKKFTKNVLLLLALVGSAAIKAQIVLTAYSPNPCGVMPAVLNMNLSSNVPTATSYVWSVVAINSPAPNTYTVFSIGAYSATISLPVTGALSVTAYPYNSSNVLLTGQIVSTTFSLQGGAFSVLMSSSSNTICAGGTVTLTANGASNYVWSNGTTGSQIVVSPTTTTCYSVVGTNNACQSNNIASNCITVLTGVNLQASASPSVVCKGSSTTFSASGAQTYSWSQGFVGTNFTVIPVASGIYTVSGTNANGCVGTKTLALVVDTTCADVWPGDANSDGSVSTLDVLELGLQAGSTGPARTSASNNYVAQYANTWVGTISGGKNKCHADCNGNGTVNANDTVAIFNNYNMVHSFKPNPQPGTDEITLQFNKSAVEVGRWNTIDIHLGNSTNNVQCLGAAFEISFEPSKLVTDSIWIEYVSSGFSANAQYLYFRKTDFINGKLYAAITRTDAANKNFGERIAVLHFKTSPQLANGSTVNFGLNFPQKMTANGAVSTILGDSRNLTLTKNLTTVEEAKNILSEVSVYPNPSKDILILSGQAAKAYGYRLFDLSGRVLLDSKFNSQTSLQVDGIENGIYMLELSSEDAIHTQRITILH